jgi:acyl-lipid omega-6 desaturase (Delta-12 desaturase)
MKTADVKKVFTSCPDPVARTIAFRPVGIRFEVVGMAEVFFMSNEYSTEEVTRAKLFHVLEPFRGPHNLRGGLLAVLDWSLLCITLYFATTAPALWMRILCGLLGGLFITRLWVIGHDACHQSLFSTRQANRFIGRFCFLPSLTPYSLWEVGHNIAHHGSNNLRRADYIWAPLSEDEYLALPPWRRFMERVYRSGAGFGIYYLIELWWQRLYVPSSPFSGVRRGRFFTFDFVLVTVFAAIWIGVVAYAGYAAGVGSFAAVVTAVVLPFCVWNVLVGLVIHVHHIHPDIPWYENKQDWLDSQAVYTSTVQIDWPILNKLLHNILDHPPHHIDTRLSLFALPAAQRALEQAFPIVFRRRPLSWADHLNSVRSCKIFDYKAKRWMPFPR